MTALRSRTCTGGAQYSLAELELPVSERPGIGPLDPTLGAYPNATRLGLPGRTAESWWGWGWCLARQSYASPMEHLAYRPTYGMR